MIHFITSIKSHTESEVKDSVLFETPSGKKSVNFVTRGCVVITMCSYYTTVVTDGTWATSVCVEHPAVHSIFY